MKIILWYILLPHGLTTGEFKLATNKYADFGQSMFQRDAADATKMVLGGDDNKLEHHQSQPPMM